MTTKKVTNTKTAVSSSARQATKPLRMGEACEFLGVSRSTVRRMIDRGELKGRKVGAQWRFFLDELEAAVRTVAPKEGH